VAAEACTLSSRVWAGSPSAFCTFSGNTKLTEFLCVSCFLSCY
jgi:hypothetical protein